MHIFRSHSFRLHLTVCNENASNIFVKVHLSYLPFAVEHIYLECTFASDKRRRGTYPPNLTAVTIIELGREGDSGSDEENMT